MLVHHRRCYLDDDNPQDLSALPLNLHHQVFRCMHSSVLHESIRRYEQVGRSSLSCYYFAAMLVTSAMDGWSWTRWTVGRRHSGLLVADTTDYWSKRGQPVGRRKDRLVVAGIVDRWSQTQSTVGRKHDGLFVADTVDCWLEAQQTVVPRNDELLAAGTMDRWS